jgi:hypothetical protein
VGQIRNRVPGFPFQFYYGWVFVHSDWDPVAFRYSEIAESGTWSILSFYFNNWTSPILAIAIFALFGLTPEAWATYWRGFCTVSKHFGWTPPAPKHETLGEIQFSTRQITSTERCALRSFALNFPAQKVCSRSRPNFVVSLGGGSDAEKGYELNRWSYLQISMLTPCASLEETQGRASIVHCVRIDCNSAKAHEEHARLKESSRSLSYRTESFVKIEHLHDGTPR